MYNFDPYNVLLAIATNIPVLLMTAFVLQAHIWILNPPCHDFTLHRTLIFRCRSYQTRLMPSGSSHSGLERISHLLFSCKFTIEFLHWLLVFCKHLNWKQMCLCQTRRCWSQAHHMDLNERRTANGSHVSHFKLNQTPLEERNICLCPPGNQWVS